AEHNRRQRVSSSKRAARFTRLLRSRTSAGRAKASASERRDRFPFAMIYLDYNATTPLCAPALEAMRPFLERHHGNPSSIHAAGREARAGVDDARDRIADLLGAKPHELIFTSGGTESNNLAVLGLARAHAP